MIKKPFAICYLPFVVYCSLFVAGCAGKGINIDPSNPVYKPKSDFQQNYGFFITPDEKKKGYTLEKYQDLEESIKPFDEIETLEEFQRFEKHFWDIRDTDSDTPENEFKKLIDDRIQDVKNEIFAPETRFDINGGLTSDPARVYLLWGVPHRREKLSEDQSVFRSELTAWHYFYNGKVLAGFLFYESYGRTHLFKEHLPMLSFETLIDPLSSPLRKISTKSFPTREELIKIWRELELDDPEWIFRNALFEFSDYDRIDKNTRWTIHNALEAPEPASLTAERYKPTILGQPNIPKGTELFESGYHSFIPAYLLIAADPTGGRPSFSIKVFYADLDWEIKDKEAEAALKVRISFQNKKTRVLNEFETGIGFRGPRQAVESLIRGKDPKTGELYTRTVELDGMSNLFAGNEDQATLRQLIDDELQPGEYVVNVYLQHTDTKKYNAWREEITIR
ncbi:MAG: hypothetical protein A2750_02690 [Candidatus Yanofskybacteria bacterium RIFCSPHIGHO2_01_FULL_45_42]|uniref:GWxTD domain-containing protein n=2 Tax=Candidatus Yanofskyibacteriota TaxID=1752733 RepID=A0A1F8FQV1_9BACT|nr:MAG: hypothetical protein A2750_02690 [Candidatus Yanofskybacteria bacterium RIFCSPHIGHO2_01_FULL_45_42]OGN15090.1 MAG: hypothetical protein A3J47_00455 [Candidatus Yanofskybacteria bacterium RIFCSPHIGHO2_02_FULL_43_22]